MEFLISSGAAPLVKPKIKNQKTKTQIKNAEIIFFASMKSFICYCFNFAIAALIRLIVSSFPKTSIISNGPGEAFWPESAALNGQSSSPLP